MRITEIVVGGVIIGALAAVGMPAYMNLLSGASDTSSRNLLGEILDAHQQYHLIDPDQQYAETSKLLEEQFTDVDFKVIADRATGAHIVVETGDGKVWSGSTETGDTKQISDRINAALDEAGIDKDHLAGGPLGQMLGSLEAGTLTEDQISAILRG